MFFNQPLLKTIEVTLQNYDPYYKEVNVCGMVGGGSVNQCYKLQSRRELFFLKVNRAELFPRMFLAEAEGLKRIRETRSIRVPEVIAVGEESGEQFLLMKWVESGKNDKQAQQHLGTALAEMHENKGDSFGLDHDNYMGSLPQKNIVSFEWPDFFIRNRLLPQAEMALAKGLISSGLFDDLYKLFGRIPSLIPPEKPSLVHGDLWSGNYVIDGTGRPVLIDPAIVYGHREVDLAMSLLFGGFDPAFYDSYEENVPLEKGWRDRVDLLNLYPLLMHVNLFGAGYVQQMSSCLRKYL